MILRLRRYRDRMQEIAAGVSTTPDAGSTGVVVAQRRITSLKSDLDKDVHECAIGRRRLKQTECEHDFLWPALREAAAEIHGSPRPGAPEAALNAGVSAAQDRIQHYLSSLEDRWPNL